MRATHALFAAALPSLSQALLLTDKSYTPCHTASQVESVNITPCDEEPCTFTKGTTVHFIMAGTSQQEVDAVNLKMDAQLGQHIFAGHFGLSVFHQDATTFSNHHYLTFITPPNSLSDPGAGVCSIIFDSFSHSCDTPQWWYLLSVTLQDEDQTKTVKISMVS
ncbi:hypothetical protein PMG11_00432 [Penicillium brasilianum]|uniref:Uncharacterized protein n=1 Tax=Penicillium brasilianum TaxID=104259 RepID=A0A0F7TCK0_PENBI|nr:hypothetical protein PMG11_00432 [Penicillium brasilianum]